MTTGLHQTAVKEIDAMPLRGCRLKIKGSGALKKRIALWMVAFALMSCVTANARANTPVTAILAGGAALLAHDAIFHPTQSHRGRISADVGEFDVIQQKTPAFETRVAYQWGRSVVWRLKPFVGLGLTSDLGTIVYGGLRLTEPLTRHWFASFDLGIALYSRGQGKRLGSAGLGRSGLSLGYRFRNGARVAVNFHHMSHDGLFSHYNPGVETASMSFSWPFQ